MRGLLALLLWSAWCLVPGAAPAATRLPAFEPGEHATLRSVVDGSEVVLEDGRILRLAGIDAPRPRTPLAERAKAALEKLLLGREIELRFAGNRRDRHGRAVAHLFVGRRWVQGELLNRGLARVAGTADNRLGLAEMLAREAKARQARRGLWHDPFYAVRQAEEAGRFAGSFQIVEGRIVDAATVEGQVFLNFAEDWRHGFSLRFAPETMRLFRGEGLDVTALRGKRVRVRGWIRGADRPTIDVTFPEQIERL